MHKKLMGAVAAAVLFSAPAFAQDDMNQTSLTTETEVEGTEVQTQTEADLGTGGSGDLDTNFTGSTQADAPALPAEDGINASTDADINAYGGAANEGTDVTATNQVVVKDEDKNDMRGLVVNLGGGVEGYTGALGNQIDAGPAWGVSAIIKPSKVLGIELGYSGAANEIGQDGAFQDSSEAASGADIVRNGAHALATLGLTATPVQPYALAGLGVSRYTVRANTSRFNDDWAGSVPVGAGVRTHIGNFTADLRGTYSMMFDQDLAVSEGASNEFLGRDFLTAGRWAGTLNLGTTW